MALLATLYFFATLIHYFSLRTQEERELYSKLFGKRGFWVHFGVTFFLWMMLVVFFAVDRELSRYVWLQEKCVWLWVGNVLRIGGYFLVGWSFWLLGIKRAWGIRYFDKSIKSMERRGPYKYLVNPIYDGFMLMFLGKAFYANSWSYLLFALESFVLLNLFLGGFENMGLIKRGRFRVF